MITRTTYTARWIELDTGEERSRECAHVQEAVRVLDEIALDVNTEPLGIEPVPDRERFAREEGLSKRIAWVQKARAMQWAQYGEEWVAQGNGRRWTIVDHTDGKGKGRRLYTLWCAPLDDKKALTIVKRDCASLEQAQRYTLCWV